MTDNIQISADVGLEFVAPEHNDGAPRVDIVSVHESHQGISLKPGELLCIVEECKKRGLLDKTNAGYMLFGDSKRLYTGHTLFTMLESIFKDTTIKHRERAMHAAVTSFYDAVGKLGDCGIWTTFMGYYVGSFSVAWDDDAENTAVCDAMTDLEKFRAFCDSAEFGLVYDIKTPEETGTQYLIQFRYEAGNGCAGGPIFYFDPDGSFVCQE